MRITNLYQFDTTLANLQSRQAALTESQLQLTSGKRINRASDDPSEAARAERSAALIRRGEAETRALDSARNALELSEGALAEGGEILQQAREILLAAGNGTQTDNERRIQAEALRGLREDLLSVANRADGAGRWLFGGPGSSGPPLLDAPGGVAYVGSGGAQQGPLGASLPLTLDGSAVWLAIPDPANPGSAISIFDTLDQVIGELATPGQGGAAAADAASRAVGRMDAAIGNLSAFRSRAGEALNRTEAMAERVAQRQLDAKGEKSAAEDLDMVAAISDFQNRQTGYDAALRAYSMVQRMSLFDYLKT